MNKILSLLALAGIFLISLLAGCSKTVENGAPPTGMHTGATGAPLVIAVIPKGTTHEYWKSIHAGADKAAADLAAKGAKVQIIWKGALREDDRDGQVSVVQTFVNKKVNAIVLAPCDADALVRPAEAAVAAGIPVIVMDSALNSTKTASFVATDNAKGGAIDADALSKFMGGKGNVLVMRYAQGSASTEAREQGFLTEIAKYPQIKIVSSNQFGGATVDSAYRTAQNLLIRYASTIQGVFVPNESTTRGMLHALKDAGLLGKVKFVGFDASPDLDTALAAKQIQGLVVQNPYKMGYLSVMSAVDLLQGKPPAAKIDTGATLVTPENMNQPESQKLLHPPTE